MTNIFLITVDDLRADHVGYVDQSKNLTPNLDTFAKDNISFTNAIATGPMTWLSFPSILYSLYPSEYFRHKMYSYEESVASYFQKRGYNTAAFNSNPHFKRHGLSKGFRFFEDFLDETGEERNGTFQRMKQRIVDMVGKDSFITKSLQRVLTRISTDIVLPYAEAKRMNQRVIEWLDKSADSPFFCWVHYMDPHYPFFPPEEYREGSEDASSISRLNRLHKRAELYHEDLSETFVNKIIDLYGGEVRYFAEYFGRFLTEIKERGLYDDSIVIFTADHGELFGDYGRFGHQHDVLYQKQIHVPLVVKTPDNEKGQVDWPVSLIDIPYTLACMVADDNTAFKGHHLWKTKHEYVLSEGFNWKMFSSEDADIDCRGFITACQNDGWKLILDEIHNRNELYNLKNDPEESIDLYDSEREISDLLKESIMRHRNNMKQSEKVTLRQHIRKLKETGKI